MNLVQVWGALVIFLVCPLLGGLPLISWIVRALVRRQLTQLGTGNVSVSAAFYHGGNLAGILAVLSEASKGIAAVILARTFFPAEPAWELIALIALVMGRYWMSKGAGTTNVIWGFVVHDWRVALLVFIMGGVGFTILRERQLGRLGVLVLFPLITALLHPEDSAEIGAAIALAVLLGWIYQKIPDDLDLPTHAGQAEAQPVFRFFRGDKAIISLDAQVDASKVGKKAATLSHLKRLGYPVPTGWVLPAGDDPEPLIKCLQPSARTPLVVRSSAIGEDSEAASAAGQYETVLNVTSREELQQAIIRCQASYDDPSALQYRRDRQLSEEAMAVLIQIQVQGVFSGVAFSRDPIASAQPDAVVIEALPGDATRVVSGQVTPEQYRVLVMERDLTATSAPGQPDWILPEGMELAVEGEGDLPPALIRQVAFLARHLEREYHGVPQDIEWSYDGRYLWLLQSRPITTLLPIWTRKIAAEVIPGLIRPLTWSINRPLTCGVWGDIFTVVLGDHLHEAKGVSAELDFAETATLHYSHAYFNASLLGQIFRCMGLPPESLEFLTRGAKFSKPPLRSTLRNVPGLLRLLKRELRLEKDFKRDYQHLFAPNLSHPNPEFQTPNSLLERIDTILELLNRATYYSIMAPLSAALRQAVLKVKDADLDNSETPEVASLRAIASLAARTQQQFPQLAEAISQGGFERLAQTGGQVLAEFDELIERYGYLSEVGTDIAVATWREDPQPVRELFVQFLAMAVAVGGVEPPRRRGRRGKRGKRGKKGGWVQRRVDLKGRVTEVYSQLLAELRWCFVGIEQVWLQSGVLAESGDIFFLEFEEIRRVVAGSDSTLLGQLVRRRRSQFEQDSQLDAVPALVYGNTPPLPPTPNSKLRTPNSKLFQGIGASPGQFEGRVRVLRNLQSAPEIDRDTILVVPYTDSGWAPLLARVGGLIAEVGGSLSHGAIVAREYGIPAVMDIHDATRLLQDGQRVRIDGQKGTVEII